MHDKPERIWSVGEKIERKPPIFPPFARPLLIDF